MQRMISVLSLMALLAAAGPVPARTLAEVELPEEVVLEADGSRLLLNGAGVVRQMFTDLLVGALYLPRRQRDAGNVIVLPEPARVQIHVLYPHIDVDDLEEAWLACLENSTDLEHSRHLLPRLRALLQLIPDLRRGDVLAVDLHPGLGARLHLDLHAQN